MQLSIIKRDAKRWNKNVYFKIINSTQELIDYINKGDKTIDRNNLKIEAIKIFSHGLPSILDFGLDGKNEKTQQFTFEDVKKISQDVFLPNAEIYSYACRTGNLDGKTEGSLAQVISNHLNVTTYAYLRRSNYTSTWLDGNDKNYTKDYITIDDENVSNPLNLRDWIRKGWDEALWNINGAYLAPTVGNSPKELESGMFMFKKDQKPQKQ